MVHPPLHLGRLLELGWEFTRDGMIVGDCRTGELVEANPAAEQMTGYSRQELLDMHQAQLHPQSERDTIQVAFRNASSTGPGIFNGYHLQRKDGAVVPVSISSSVPFEADGRLLVIGIFRDVSDQEDREQRLETKRWALRAYGAAALALGRARSSEGLMQNICEAITDQSVFVLAWIGFPDGGPGKLVSMAGAAGPAIHYMDGLEVSWDENKPSGQGPTGVAYRTNTNQLMNDSESEEVFRPWREKARLEGIRSSLTVPFPVGDDRSGVLAVYASEPCAFGPVVFEAFTHLAEEIGIGLHSLEREERLAAESRERELAQKDLSAALSAVVGAITTAFEMRDPYTAGHQERVSEIACAIAKEMGWQENRVAGLRVAALVHDIGKIAIPTEILVKPTRLTAAEWTMIKAHPELGYTILKDVPFDWPIAESVRQHHERMDGSGYPAGLKGDQINLGARILAVADIVEAMAASRPYRPGLGLEVALKEIERQAGTLLDPEIVRMCLSLFRNRGFTPSGWNHR